MISSRYSYYRDHYLGGAENGGTLEITVPRGRAPR